MPSSLTSQSTNNGSFTYGQCKTHNNINTSIQNWYIVEESSSCIFSYVNRDDIRQLRNLISFADNHTILHPYHESLCFVSFSVLSFQNLQKRNSTKRVMYTHSEQSTILPSERKHRYRCHLHPPLSTAGIYISGSIMIHVTHP